MSILYSEAEGKATSRTMIAVAMNPYFVKVTTIQIRNKRGQPKCDVHNNFCFEGEDFCEKM